ncbi:hypothetical protein [Shimia aestuarii]|uniref:hypothetical protein n=1 Tax=Shimia aestuarii TaxID=254406 RepID=UPI001FB4C493|nr:hypothetical protein [Shimia aestuarii]
MSLKPQIEKIEDRLKRHGKQVSELCEAVPMARSTWQRWKSDLTSPNMSTWTQVLEAVDELCASKSEEDAA